MGKKLNQTGVDYLLTDVSYRNQPEQRTWVSATAVSLEHGARTVVREINYILTDAKTAFKNTDKIFRKICTTHVPPRPWYAAPPSSLHMREQLEMLLDVQRNA